MPEPHSTGEFALIPGHTAYRISPEGLVQTCLKRVKGNVTARTKRWKDLKGCVNRDGYRVFVLIHDGGGRTYFYLHVLLMLVFVGPCPEGKEVCHEDDDKSNNSLMNLYYGTRKQNMADAYRNGGRKRGQSHPEAALTDDQVREIRARAAAGLRWGDQKKMAQELGVSQGLICDVIKRRRWNHVS